MPTSVERSTHSEENAIKLESLRVAIEAGLDSGVGHGADAVFDRLEAKHGSAKTNG